MLYDLASEQFVQKTVAGHIMKPDWLELKSCPKNKMFEGQLFSGNISVKVNSYLIGMCLKKSWLFIVMNDLHFGGMGGGGPHRALE